MDFITNLIIAKFPMLQWLVQSDWLFGAWVIVTVLFAIDLIVPDPIPFIDEIILGIVFFVLLGALFIRWLLVGTFTGLSYLFHPVVLSFTFTLILLLIGYKLWKRRKR
jgi:hypothetical protein